MADDIMKITVDSSDVVVAADRVDDLSKSVNNAGKSGNVAGKSIDKTTRGMNQFGAVAKNGGKKLNTFNMQLQQGGYQLQDFVVQLQGGTSFFTAFGQQGSQFAGVFGPQGAVIGAIIAIGSAVGGMALAMLKASQDVRTLEERMSDTESAISSLILATERVTMSTDELRDSFGQASESAKGTLDLLREIAQLDAQKNIDSIAQSMSDLYSAAGDGERRTEIADFFDVNIFLAYTRASKEHREEARLLTAEYLNQQDILRDSDGDLVAQIASTEKLIATSQALAELKDGVSDAERESIRVLAENLSLMQKMQGAKEKSKISSDEMARAEEAANAELLLGEQMLALEREKALDQFNKDLAATNATIDAMFQNRTLYFSIRFSGDATVMGQSLAPSGKMKPTQSYEELIGMGWSPEDLARIGMNAPKVKSGGGGGSKESPQEKFAEYLADKEKELELETKLVGIFDTEREIQSELFKARDEYSGVITPAQEKELENTLRQTEAIKEQQTVLEEAKAQQKELSDTIAGHMGDAFTSIIDGTKSASDAFKDMARLIISELFKVLVVEKMVKSISGSIGSIFPSANGNVFSGGSHVQAYANGGVVGGPTMFPMSGGKTGLMGEAGPEAIMPLKRGSNGKLGVQMEGGAGGDTVVNNYFNVSANGDDSVKRIIRGEIPRITEATKAAVVDAKRRGGSYGRSF